MALFTVDSSGDILSHDVISTSQNELFHCRPQPGITWNNTAINNTVSAEMIIDELARFNQCSMPREIEDDDEMKYFINIPASM